MSFIKVSPNHIESVYELKQWGKLRPTEVKGLVRGHLVKSATELEMQSSLMLCTAKLTI